VHLPDEATRLSPEALRDWLVEQRITISFAPTVLAERLISLDWPSNTRLRILLTGADTLQHYPPAGLPFTLVNNYGPTECTVVATSGAVWPNECPSSLPPIGRPIDNVSIYLLDDELRLVPRGEAGAVYIGGAGVSRGYINHPELTAERFIPNPFGGALAGQLYRTGDRARFLPNGQLEFLGRIDDQVKMRGYRIELNEIGCALSRHPSIQSSVVTAREDERGNKQLVAYIVRNNSKEPSASELREHLRVFLPEYMVPAVFLSLPSLPLSPNGKINRAALPEPSPFNTIRDEEFEPPHTPTEKKLAELLAIMLETERVGASDNFFLLGGHSLLGTQLIVKIRNCFGVELNLRALFDHPTVSGIAAQIDRLVTN
jgi:acyl-coenzyme A synthetase/AMP-(fatty) acid ligase/acyl carrier protein